MKYLTILLLLIATTNAGLCQQATLTISGMANGSTAEVNFPGDDSYLQSNSTILNADFGVKLKYQKKLQKPAFFYLGNENNKHYLLMTPGKTLKVSYADSNKITLAGDTKPVNELLLSSPFNNKNSRIHTIWRYNKTSADSLVNIILPRVKHERDSTLRVIDAAKMDAQQKSILSTELTYFYATKLLIFADNIRYKYDSNEPWKKLQDAVIKDNSLPDSEQLTISPSANAYLKFYLVGKLHDIGFLMQNAGKDKNAGNPAHDEICRREFGITYDSVKYSASKYGDGYLLGTLAKKHLKNYAGERFLTNTIVRYADEKNLQGTIQITNDLETAYPGSTFLPLCRQKVAQLQQILKNSEADRSIVIINDSSRVSSLKALVAPYKGKIVYLDIWGTWCGPCVNEITEHTPKLKERFKGKDIVFLYLEGDNDYTGYDLKWTDFVKMHTVAGQHLRVSNKKMENLWVELKVNNESRYFPTYVIFDKDGNILEKGAKRPSDGEALYQDLEAALSK